MIEPRILNRFKWVGPKGNCFTAVLRQMLSSDIRVLVESALSIFVLFFNVFHLNHFGLLTPANTRVFYEQLMRFFYDFPLGQFNIKRVS